MLRSCEERAEAQQWVADCGGAATTFSPVRVCHAAFHQPCSTAFLLWAHTARLSCNSMNRLSCGETFRLRKKKLCRRCGVVRPCGWRSYYARVISTGLS